MTPPSILLIGPFDDALHAHSTQRARALERLGCDVTIFDLLKRPGLLGRLAGSDLRSRLLKTIEVAEADLVIVLGGYELEEALVDSIRSSSGIRWINWFPDDIRMADDCLRVARPYDALFAPATDLVQYLEQGLGRTVELLPFAADPSVYRPLRSRDQYRANVVFAGAASPEREALLAGLVEYGLALWGPGWRKTSLKDYCRGEARQTAEFVRAYGGASVAVNLHPTAGTAPVYCNQRLFELAAIGVPQVVDDRRDLPQFFDPGRDVAVFREPAELRALVERLLHDPPTAEELGASARRQALARHTYMHRMRRILEVGGISPEQPIRPVEAAVDGDQAD
jgi:spore maturation protein CgeB